MEYVFKKLECNDAVLSFSDKTFKLGHFKEEVKKEFTRQLNRYLNDEGFGYISILGMRINLDNIIWKSVTLYNCELLHLTAKSWQSGKLRIQVSLIRTKVPRSTNRRHKAIEVEVIEIQDILLEFCPYKPKIVEQIPEITEAKSSLEDIRRMISEARS
ncbi:MAG: KGK domain-containing protein [Rhizonema sp. PD37]|nr:KGK domain-containing protein [Rhizonema sp. PD37]